jgi:hypothetical protein
LRHRTGKTIRNRNQRPETDYALLQGGARLDDADFIQNGADELIETGAFSNKTESLQIKSYFAKSVTTGWARNKQSGQSA